MLENTLIAMATFAFVGAATPGPVNLLATSTAVNFGVREAAKHVFGASVAYALVVFLSGSVMQLLLNLLPRLEWAMQIGGSLYLFYLAYKIYTAPTTAQQSLKPARSGLWTGSITQLINPKAWIVALSGISLFVLGQDNQHNALIAFTGISLVICLLGVGLWAATGSLLARALDKPLRQRHFNRLMSALLVASVIAMWIET